MKWFVQSIIHAEGIEKDPNTGQVESAGRLRSFGVNVCRRGLQTLKSVDASFFILRLLSIALLLWCRQCWKNNTPLISQAELNDLSWSVVDEKKEIGDGNTVGTTTFAIDEAADVKTKRIVPDQNPGLTIPHNPEWDHIRQNEPYPLTALLQKTMDQFSRFFTGIGRLAAISLRKPTTARQRDGTFDEISFETYSRTHKKNSEMNSQHQNNSVCPCTSPKFGKDCSKTCQNGVLEQCEFCKCNEHFVGLECDTPCQHGWYDPNAPTQCKCEDDWVGPECSIECYHGEYDSGTDSCKCIAGYQGSSCNVECVNGHVETEDGKDVCKCNDDWYGSDCSFKACHYGETSNGVCSCYPYAATNNYHENVTCDTIRNITCKFEVLSPRSQCSKSELNSNPDAFCYHVNFDGEEIDIQFALQCEMTKEAAFINTSPLETNNTQVRDPNRGIILDLPDDYLINVEANFYNFNRMRNNKLNLFKQENLNGKSLEYSVLGSMTELSYKHPLRLVTVLDELKFKSLAAAQSNSSPTKNKTISTNSTATKTRTTSKSNSEQPVKRIPFRNLIPSIVRAPKIVNTPTGFSLNAEPTFDDFRYTNRIYLQLTAYLVQDPVENRTTEINNKWITLDFPQIPSKKYKPPAMDSFWVMVMIVGIIVVVVVVIYVLSYIVEYVSDKRQNRKMRRQELEESPYEYYLEDKYGNIRPYDPDVSSDDGDSGDDDSSDMLSEDEKGFNGKYD
ncbi:hypothetical protein BLNAU_940 [Blattamonas nauphoetae]|uniref:EGF-like domain-containing protein n=1 Tax=Blattamonas nauphoetae TaxID=2049346 RepID=A0ABQ9YJF1_9EUKA|nr:hypothetical protein BLNAU_940 [Blattamonas nauphoetae]